MIVISHPKEEAMFKLLNSTKLFVPEILKKLTAIRYCTVMYIKIQETLKEMVKVCESERDLDINSSNI